MDTYNDLPVLFFEEPEDWAKWLAANLESNAVWVKFAKKKSGVKSINYDQALEVALCYGWIDGLVNSLDETYYLQRFTPRRPRSNWSVRNRMLVEKLIADGKMQPSGQIQIDLAKADGRWEK